MFAKLRIKRPPKCTTPRVVVDALGVYESGYAASVSEAPSLRKETLIQIDGTSKIRIVLP